MSSTLVLGFAWNPMVGVPMLVVGIIALLLLWLFGQPRREQGTRRPAGDGRDARREPVLGEGKGEPTVGSIDVREDSLPSIGPVTAPEQGELDVGLRAELERLGATLAGKQEPKIPAVEAMPVPRVAPGRRAEPKLADHVASIINALRAPPAGEAPAAAGPEPSAPTAAPAGASAAQAVGPVAPPHSDIGRRPAQVPVERIVSLFVVAREGKLFSGADLVVAAEKAGLEFGDMGIFHRLVDGKRELGPIFSVANMLKPGSFDLAHLDLLHTPGVSFFMTLPAPMPALDAWDAMLPTAQRLGELLDGLVLDEERNALGRQCVAHIRDQLRTWDRDHEGVEVHFDR